MILTSENYHSPEANFEYLGHSQYKDFCGSRGKRGCEAMAMAKLNYEWIETPTPAQLVGSYVDSHFEGTLELFRAKHPQILKKDGSLLASFSHANEIIARIERDPYMMKFMDGQKQVIMTADLFGVKWKIKIDSFIPEICIVDLKVMRELRESFWIRDYGYTSFVGFWGYDIQAALYQKVVEINTGKKLPFYIAAASKEDFPDIEIIGFTQDNLDEELYMIEKNVERIKKLKAGEAEPDRCGLCDFCKSTKVLSKPIHFNDLIQKIYR